jgi:hypothetical protein
VVLTKITSHISKMYEWLDFKRDVYFCTKQPLGKYKHPFLSNEKLIHLLVYRNIVVMHYRLAAEGLAGIDYKFMTDVPDIHGPTMSRVARQIDGAIADHLHYDIGLRLNCEQTGPTVQTHCRLRLMLEGPEVVPVTTEIDKVTCPLCFSEITRIELKKDMYNDTYGFQDVGDQVTYPGQMDWTKHRKIYLERVEQWGMKPVVRK